MTNIPLVGEFRVTCEFDRKNSSDLNWVAGFHTGIDLVGNDTIYATCDGKAVRIGFDENFGNFIVIRDDIDLYYHWFCHLSKISVSVGQRVSRISRIGVMGATGNATGKHLHFEIRRPSNNYADVVDPANYMGIPNVVGVYNTENYPIYRSHLQDIGWQYFVAPGHVSGTTGESRRLEAIQIMSDLVEYRTHLQDIGWTDWAKGEEISGTTGQSRRLEAIEFKSSKRMIVQGHVQDIGWQDERRGTHVEIGTTGQSLRLEAFRFRFEE